MRFVEFVNVRNLTVLVAAVFVALSVSACGSLVQSGGGESGGGDGGDQGQSSGGGGETTASGGGGQQEGDQGGAQSAEAPNDPTLSLTIPSIDKTIENIPTGRGDDVQLLTDNAAVHVYPTGFPWQAGANTFLAGHVEGYEGTPSYRAFDGIQQLENGDEIIVTDSNGTDYTYTVFNSEIVTPDQTEVLNPVEGRSIVTLQTCEIVNINPDGTPDYSNTERLIVQGELQS